MIYLSGSPVSKTPKTIGFMATPFTGINLVRDGRYWGGDNGGFTGKFDENKFFNFLDKMVEFQKTCLFIACPDKLCDPFETMKLYDKYAMKIKEKGYKVAFVCQDGQEAYDIPECDAVFIGGSTEWKLGKGADKCIKTAKERGLWVHVGRVNTRGRIIHFKLRGVDSVDGNCIGFGPDVNIPKIQRWMKERVLFDDLYCHVSDSNSVG
jgi:hypothetical protein